MIISSITTTNMEIPLSKPHALIFFLILASSLTHGRSDCKFEQNSMSKATTNVKGMFVFGSSLIDNGNNKFLQTTISSDFLPYGDDFPYGPSGQYTNGKNVGDLLVDRLCLPYYIPPSMDPSAKGRKIAFGVNFASGGSGIMDDTGSFLGDVMSLKKQISDFESTTLVELESVLGCRSRESLSNYLFLVGTGGNDYSFNYFLNNPPNSEFDTAENLQAFTSNLTSSLSLHLQKLYSLGARKFVLVAVYPLGCYPYLKAGRPMRRGCLQSMNRAAHLFNSNLMSLVDNLPNHLPNSHFVFLNSYKILRDMIKDPVSRGFKYAEEPCCEVLALEEGGNGAYCKPGGSTCSNRSSHVFFDGIHPTEAANVHIANKAFTSHLKSEVYPFNVEHLSTLVV